MDSSDRTRSLPSSAATPVSLWHLLGLPPSDGYCCADIDAAHARLSNPTDRAHYAWKALRDDCYRHLYCRIPDEALLARAGFFDDGLQTPVERSSAWTIPAWSIPLAKIGRRLTGRQERLAPDARAELEPAAVLLCTGAFSPVHQGHLAMMQAAREHLQAQGIFVAGGYLSPSHDAYVSFKQHGQARLHVGHRLALCQEAVADSDWLEGSPWEGRYAPTALNFTDCIRHLEGVLQRAFPGRALQVVYVFGSDNLEFLGAAQQRRFVCVERGPMTPAQRQALATLRQAGFDARTVRAEGIQPELSSTRVRAGDHSGLLPAVRSRYCALKAAKSEAHEQPTPIATPLRYLLRDDLDWATRTWGLAPGAARAFTLALKDLLELSFRTVPSCEQRLNVTVECLSRDAQARHVRALEQLGPVVSLDAAIPARHTLAVSRWFSPADGQVFSRGLDARPGALSVEAQLAALRGLNAQRVTVVEDDVATGSTWRQVQSWLQGVTSVGRLVLLNTWSLSQVGLEGALFHDIVDARDFLIGADEGGLVVELPAEGPSSVKPPQAVRVPYLLPWVSNVFRSRLPASTEAWFCAKLWRLNAHWLEKFAPMRRVEDCSAPSRAFWLAIGTPAGEPLFRLADRHARWAENLSEVRDPR